MSFCFRVESMIFLIIKNCIPSNFSVLIKFIPLPLGVDGIYNGELTKGMVITTIAACFSNSMLNSAYFTLNFWFRQLYGTFKITQLFIFLSTYPACISNTIFEGKAEFELYINHIG
jgi:hypothetical protein